MVPFCRLRMAMASERFLAFRWSLSQRRCMMSSIHSPGLLSFGPRDAHILLSLPTSAAPLWELALTQILMATASGKGSVTSTPVMVSAARVTPFFARWMKEMLRTASAEAD
eukprot:5160146-Heterocapsa_arctica.AAC.1